MSRYEAKEEPQPIREAASNSKTMALLEKIHGKEISADSGQEDLSRAVVPSKPVVDLEAKPNNEGLAS